MSTPSCQPMAISRVRSRCSTRAALGLHSAIQARPTSGASDSNGSIPSRANHRPRTRFVAAQPIKRSPTSRLRLPDPSPHRRRTRRGQARVDCPATSDLALLRSESIAPQLARTPVGLVLECRDSPRRGRILMGARAPTHPPRGNGGRYWRLPPRWGWDRRRRRHDRPLFGEVGNVRGRRGPAIATSIVGTSRVTRIAGYGDRAEQRANDSWPGR